MHPEALKILHLHTWPRKHFRRCAQVRASLATTLPIAAQGRARPRTSAQNSPSPTQLIFGESGENSVNPTCMDGIKLIYGNQFEREGER